MKSRANEFAAIVKKLGLSQAEVARRLFITPSAVSQLCHGIIQPRLATLNQLKLIDPRITREALAEAENSIWGSSSSPERRLLEDLQGLPAGIRRRLVSAFQEMVHTMQSRPKRRREGKAGLLSG